MNFDELCQEVILDHARRPRNFGEMSDAGFRAQGDNPQCGDEITIYLKMAGDRLEAVSFTGAGCSVCLASASLMTGSITGRTRAESAGLTRSFYSLLTAEDEPAPDPALGDLRVFTGLRTLPLRVKCATLPWRTLERALGAAPA